MEEQWRIDAARKLQNMPDAAKEVRERALSDLYYFARLVNPGYVYGEIHRKVFRWMQEYSIFGQGEALTSNKLIMLPRAHLKSHMVATWCAWIVARHPEISILYVSATAELAITQLYAIKNILGGTVFRRYFPEYVDPQEGKREKWSSTKISVDHAKRAKEGIMVNYKTTNKVTVGQSMAFAVGEIKHKWSIHMLAIGVESNGKKRFEVEEVALPEPLFQHQLVDYLNEHHEALKVKFEERNKLTNLAWLAVPNGDSIDNDQIDAILTKYGAW